MSLATDFRYALRSLRAHPFHAIVAAGSLAIGVSTVTGVVALREASRDPSATFPNAARIVAISRVAAPSPQGRFSGLTRAGVGRIAAEAKAIAAIGVWSSDGGALAMPDGFISAYGLTVSGSLPRVLGIKPAIGRLFSDLDGAYGTPAVVVLSHAFWKSRFGGDSSVAGRSFLLDGVTRTIVGVLPPGAQLIEGAQYWSAKSLDRILADSVMNMQAVAQLAAGESAVSVTAELRRLGTTETVRVGRQQSRTLQAEPLHVMLGAQTVQAMMFLSMLGIIVAIIAATNFAVLILARGMQRHAELGIRAALGASAAGLARYLMLECALLGIAGGAAGALLAPGVVSLIANAAEGMLPGWVQLQWSLPTVGAGVTIAVVIGVLFGAAPAFELARPAATGFIRGGAAMLAGSKRQAAGRRRLVASQIALATGTLVFLGVMFGSLIELGFSKDDRSTLSLFTGTNAYRRSDTAWKEPAARGTLIQAAESADGAVSAAVSQDYYITRKDVTALPSGTFEEHDIRSVLWARVTSRYFETVRPTLLYGRVPSEAEISRGEPVAAVSEAMRVGLGIGQQVGWRLRLNPVRTDELVTVVGVLADPSGPANAGNVLPTVYTALGPSQRATFGGQRLWVRSRLAPRSAIPAIAEGLRRMAPMQTIVDIQSVADRNRLAVREFRQIVAIAMGVFVLALGLAALGIYGIITFGAMARRKEMAIRTALGGSRAHLAHVVTRDAAVQAVVGLVLGIAGGIAAAAMLVTRPVLFLIPPADVIGAAVLSVGIVVLLSSIAPVRRVWQTDCADALRSDG